MEKEMTEKDMDTALRVAGASFVSELDKRGLRVRHFEISYLLPSRENEKPTKQICLTFDYELK